MNILWSGSPYSLWSSSTGSRSDGRPSGIVGGRSSCVARVSQLNWLKSDLGIAPLLVILLSAEDS